MKLGISIQTFFVLLGISFWSQAAEINTSFEFTNTSGSFTLTDEAASATFSGGAAKSVGIFSLYHSGANAWMIAPGAAGNIDFNPPAQQLRFFFRTQSGNAASTLELLDSDGQLLGSFSGSSSGWSEINVDMANLGKPVSKVVLRNEANEGYAVLDDLTAIAAEIPVNQRLDDPIPAQIRKGTVRLRLKQIADGLAAPNWAVSAPGDLQHLFVSDQDGKLWRVNLSDNTKSVFLDLSSRLVPLGAFGSGTFDERGFLGFAFHPQYAENGLLYTYTSEPAGEISDFSTIPDGFTANHRSVIREWRLSLDNSTQNQAAVLSERVLLSVDQPQFNHNAGGLNFGPDGMLYIALGDGGGADDRDGQEFAGSPMIGHGDTGNAQNTANLLGSVLRIDPAGNNAANGRYGIPADNPFAGSESILNEIYAYGFRNPFRFSFDTASGALVLADVGQSAIEEVNLIQAGGNYGWNTKEGSFRFDSNGNDAGFVTSEPVSGNLIDPVVQYDHDEGTAIIGGFVYRGGAIAALQQTYVFGDVAKTGAGDGRLFYTQGSEILELDLTERDAPGFWVLGFGQDGDDELYVLGNQTGIPFGSTGAVYKLVPNADFSGGILTLPAVTVISDGGKDDTYRVRLQVSDLSSQPLRLELIYAEKLTENFQDDNAVFNPETGVLNISDVNVISDDNVLSTYSAELELIPGLPSLTFELKQAVLVK